MGNSVIGGSQETRTMQYYDRLPRSVREALQNCIHDFAVGSWLKQFERGQIKAKDLVKKINEWDRKYALKHCDRVWGDGYPKELIAQRSA